MNIFFKTVGLVFFLLLFIPSIVALRSSPISFQEVVIINSSKLVFFNLTNNQSFALYNVSSSGSFQLGRIEKLSVNETVLANFSVSSNVSVNTNVSLFGYLLQEISLVPMLVEVNVTSAGFVPNDFVVVNGSTITWVNRDVINHTVTGSFANVELGQNQSFGQVFTVFGGVDVFDQKQLFFGHFDVVNASSLVSILDTSSYLTIPFSVVAVFSETLLDAVFVEPSNASLVLRDDGTAEGVIKISNSGNKTAVNVSIVGNWSIFSKQDFNVSVGSSSFVTFTLLPQLNETNKVFVYDFLVRGNNVNNVSLNLSVFVPLINLTNRSFDTSGFFRERLVFCNSFPTSPFCLSDPLTVERNVTVFKEPLLPYNYTQRDIDAINRKFLELNELVGRSENYYKDNLDKVSGDLDLLKNASFSSSAEVGGFVRELKETRSEFDGFRVANTIFFIILIIGIVGVVLFLIFRKLYNKHKFNKGIEY